MLDGRMVDPEFAGYVEARQHELLRVAYLVCGDAELARELLQQALVKLALRWSRLRDENPDAYVQRVLIREAMSWRHRVHREPPQPTGDDDELELHRALADLTVRQRAVLVLRCIEDLTEFETAELLGVSPNTVRSQTQAALNRLRTVTGLRPEETR